MTRVEAVGVWLALLTSGCGAPPPDRADVPMTYDLPEVSLVWEFDAPPSSGRPDVPRVDRPPTGPVDLPPTNPCDGGQVVCPYSSACVDLQSDREHCGSCGTACPEHARCAAGVCTVTCPTGLTACGPGLVCTDVSTDRDHCGACLYACSAGRRCVAGACAQVCPEGMEACGSERDVCADTRSDVRHCGRCGVSCVTEHAAASCVDGACAITCDAGYSRCEGRDGCVSIRGSDRTNCGACGRTCEPGLGCALGECVATGARLLSPLSGTQNASWRPYFRWEPPPGGGSVVVEVCSSRDCHEVEGSQRVDAGDGVRWATPLSRGPHFWRARPAVTTAVRPGPTWEFFIPERDAPVPLVGRVVADYNGDGIADGGGSGTGECPLNRQCIGVGYSRAPGAVLAAPTLVQSPENSEPYEHEDARSFSRNSFVLHGPVGDFNGDGFVDMFVTLHLDEQTGPARSIHEHLSVHFGAATGIPSAEAYERGLHLAMYERIEDVGDVDGDGCADLAVTGRRWVSLGGEVGPVYHYVYFGGATGTLSDTRASPYAYLGWSDFDGDGRTDLVMQQSEGAVPDPLRTRIRMGGTRSLNFQPLPDCGSLTQDELDRRDLQLSAVSDTNADGYPDLTAQWGATSAREETLIWLGGPRGFTAARCVRRTPSP